MTTHDSCTQKRAFQLFGGVLLALACAACSDGTAAAGATSLAPGMSPTEEPLPNQEERVGTVSLSLDLAGGIALDSFSYAITGPGYSKAARVDVSKSRTVSVLIADIPAGADYAVTLSGSASKPYETACSGSAAFSIVAGQTTTVPVAIACHVQDAVNPPVSTAAAPVPLFASAAIGLVLLAAGVQPRRRRAQGVNGTVLSKTLSK